MDFIAIDFEIANENMSSACSIGLAYVDNNEVIKEKYFLIKPPQLRFDPSFTAIHGITKSDVIGQKNFDEVWELIKNDITSNLIVAHNAQFDMSVLSSCLQHYSIAIPSFSYMCSIPISTKACKGNKVGQSLKERCSYFGVDIAEHHHAGADARACAELVIASAKSKNKGSLETYRQTYSTIPVKEFTELKAQATFLKKRPKKPKFNAVSISEVTANTETFNKDHILYEKNIVFTGDLLSMDRKEAMQKTVNVGGVIKSGVSGKTNYVVVGSQDPNLVGTAGISTKEKKAKELKEKGINIEIIHEETFIKLLNNNV